MYTIQPFLLFMCLFCVSPLSFTSKRDVQDLTTNGADVCSRDDVDLLVVVNSAARNLEDRQRSRLTWVDRWAPSVGRHRGSVRVVFFVGRPKSVRQSKSLAMENAVYHDVVWTNTDESASRSTAKAVSWLRWAIDRCPGARFVLKVDENTIVNLPAVVRLVDRNRNVANTIWGSVLHDGILKWFERLLFHPDYCSTKAYLMTRDVVKRLYIGALKPVPYNSKEHIYLTGIVAENEGIQVINNNKFKEMKLPSNHYISAAKCNSLTYKKCMSLKSNIIFDTTDNKDEWTAHWSYLTGALKKCKSKFIQVNSAYN